MSTERASRESRLGYAMVAVIGGGFALWQVAALDPTAATPPAAQPSAAIGHTLFRPKAPMLVADTDVAAFERTSPGAAGADDLDVQLESAAAAAAIEGELQGDASLP